MKAYGEGALVSMETWSGSPSIAIISDRAGTRTRLRDALHAGAINQVVEAESLDGAALHAAAPDGLVVAPGGGRTQIVEAFRAARSLFPDKPIVGLWPDAERSEDRRALRAGIDGLVQESQVETTLIPTIRAVCSGLVCFPRRSPMGYQGEALSSREKQVLGMLIMGFTNAEIGRRLYLAESTVKSHLSSAYMKLGVRSRKDAAALILDPEEGLGTGILAISSA